MTVRAYYELPGLDQVYLEDSFVLGVTVHPGSVSMTLDVVLREGHPEFAEPRSDEQYCFRRGVLSFDPVSEIRWQMPKGVPAVDASGETDYGGIDEYLVDGNTHRLVGELGELVITCGGQNLSLNPQR